MSLEKFYKHCESKRVIRLFITIFFFLSVLIYFPWRLSVINFQTPVFSIIFFVAESFVFVSILLTIFVTWKVKKRSIIKPPPDLTVDIFIPTHNEPVDMIRTTVLAVKKIRYPHKTWILDDGNRQEVRVLAGEIGCEYIAREQNLHAKAGNLNNALKHSNADYIAIFDADHIPEDYFLDHLLGYFDDPLVAFVQTPQDFYNIDSFQFRNNFLQKVLWHDQSFFYLAGQAGRDYWNATSFCGTSAVFRRSALDKIGGFATGTVTEDMHTAVRLHKSGYKSIYHPESLAFGIAATSYPEFLQQRLRWGYGNIQTLHEENVLLTKDLTGAQKICYFALPFEYFSSWSRLVFYFSPAIIFLTGALPIDSINSFIYLAPIYYLLAYLTIEEYGRGSYRFFADEYMAMARLPISILATSGIFNKQINWKTTSKEKRGKVPILLVSPQLVIILVNLYAVLTGFGVINGSFAPEFPLKINIIVCLFAAIIVNLAANVILNIFSRKRANVDYIFNITIPVILNLNEDKKYFCLTEKISVNKLVLSVNPDSLPEDKSINCSVYFPGITIPLKVLINPIQCSDHNDRRRIRCDIQEMGTNDRDLLELWLKKCNWHRQFTWNRVFIKTLLDRLIIFLNPRHYRGLISENMWYPLIYSCSSIKDTGYHMGLISHNAVTRDNYFIPYRKLVKGDVIKVISLKKDSGEEEYLVSEVSVNTGITYIDASTSVKYKIIVNK